MRNNMFHNLGHPLNKWFILTLIRRHNPNIFSRLRSHLRDLINTNNHNNHNRVTSTMRLLNICHLRSVKDLMARITTIDIIKTNRLHNRSSSLLPLRLKARETFLDQVDLVVVGYLLALVVVVVDPEVAV